MRTNLEEWTKQHESSTALANSIAEEFSAKVSELTMTEVTLPGTYCPEISGKKALIIGRQTGSLITLLQLRGLPLQEEEAESLAILFDPKKINPSISAESLEKTIEEAAVRYFSKKKEDVS